MIGSRVGEPSRVIETRERGAVRFEFWKREKSERKKQKAAGTTTWQALRDRDIHNSIPRNQRHFYTLLTFFLSLPSLSQLAFQITNHKLTIPISISNHHRHNNFEFACSFSTFSQFRSCPLLSKFSLYKTNSLLRIYIYMRVFHCLICSCSCSWFLVLFSGRLLCVMLWDFKIRPGFRFCVCLCEWERGNEKVD